jgi:hypothetical protein
MLFKLHNALKIQTVTLLGFSFADKARSILVIDVIYRFERSPVTNID